MSAGTTDDTSAGTTDDTSAGTTWDPVAFWARTQPDRLALRIGEERWTYGRLEEAVSRAAVSRAVLSAVQRNAKVRLSRLLGGSRMHRPIASNASQADRAQTEAGYSAANSDQIMRSPFVPSLRGSRPRSVPSCA